MCVDAAAGIPRLQSTGSVDRVHGLSRSAACEIFPDQGSNLGRLHWQVESNPLIHQGSPRVLKVYKLFKIGSVLPWLDTVPVFLADT